MLDGWRMTRWGVWHRGSHVLAMVQSESEGNLPRALFLVRAARQQLEKVEDLKAIQQWHRKLLRHELGILGHLSPAEQLDLIDLYEQHHQQRITERRIWQ